MADKNRRLVAIWSDANLVRPTSSVRQNQGRPNPTNLAVLPFLGRALWPIRLISKIAWTPNNHHPPTGCPPSHSAISELLISAVAIGSAKAGKGVTTLVGNGRTRSITSRPKRFPNWYAA